MPATPRRSPSGSALPEIVARLLAQRGVGLDEAPRFLAPRLRDQLPDPAHLRDMDRAVERLVRAIRDGEKIVVFGDYDVDGATSAALLLRFFAAVGGAPSVYVPDRLREGYGPNAPALLRLKAEGAGLVVTVDCGTTAHERAGRGGGCRARRHRHRPPRRRAAAAARGRGDQPEPARRDEPARQARRGRRRVSAGRRAEPRACARPAGTRGRPEPDLLQWLDLVALGTVCDVVPLTGLNRALVAQGIKVARQRRQSRLCGAGRGRRGSTAPIDAYHLGFRARAAGQCRRPGRRRRSRRAAAGDRRPGARRRAGRSGSTATTASAARSRRDAGGGDRRRSRPRRNRRRWCSPPPRAGIPASSASSRPGSRSATSGRPASSRSPTAIGKGSGRSVPGVALGPAVIAARQAGLLINGGGHAMAAGFTVAADRLDALREFLAERLGDGRGGERAWCPSCRSTARCRRQAAQARLIDHIDALAPFGAANPEPRFAFPGDPRRPCRAGRAPAHLRCTLADPLGGRRGCSRRSPSASPRRRSAQFLADTRGRAIHVAGHLRRDT